MRWGIFLIKYFGASPSLACFRKASATYRGARSALCILGNQVFAKPFVYGSPRQTDGVYLQINEFFFLRVYFLSLAR